MRKLNCITYFFFFVCAFALHEDGYCQTTNYLPLEIGNYWTFEVGLGSVSRDSVEGAVSVSDTNYYKFTQFWFTPNRLVRLDDQNQLWERLGDADVLRFKFNAAVGDTWSYPDGLMVMESRNDTITVPAGTFPNCLRIHYYFNGADNDWDEWYAPEIGPAKRILYGFFTTVYELKDFHINQNTGIRDNPDQYRPPNVENFVLMQNTPNPIQLQSPTSSSTTIYYRIPLGVGFVDTNISIYNILGQKVLTLINESKGPGLYQVSWSGRSRNGILVPGGVYLIRLTAGRFIAVRKALVLF